jgi:hypothetical protein
LFSLSRLAFLGLLLLLKPECFRLRQSFRRL